MNGFTLLGSTTKAAFQSATTGMQSTWEWRHSQLQYPDSEVKGVKGTLHESMSGKLGDIDIRLSSRPGGFKKKKFYV